MDMPRRAVPLTPTLPFERLVVFVNPKSTNSAAVQRRIDKLRAFLPDIPFATIEATGKDWSKDTRLIEKHTDLLGPHTLLCIAAGDGTTNYIIQSLLTAKLPEPARKTVLLPLWGGNANDLACMLNGAPNRINFHSLITHGHIVPIHPLECDMQPRQGERIVRIAACYAGFGATAFAAKQLNATDHRHSRLAAIPGGRLIQEVITVMNAFIEAPTFEIKDGGRTRVVYERTFANGERMARIKRLPVQLTDQKFYLNTLENKHLVSAVPRLIESTSKRLSAKFLRNYAFFTTQETSWAQFDGEPLEVPAHTKVQVQLSERPFYALSKNLTVPAKKHHD